MGKLILLVVIGFAVWWLWRKLHSGGARAEPQVSARVPEMMVGCALCGLNQPKSECVESDGRFYCCDAHRRQAGNGGEGR